MKVSNENIDLNEVIDENKRDWNCDDQDDFERRKNANQDFVDVFHSIESNVIASHQSYSSNKTLYQSLDEFFNQNIDSGLEFNKLQHLQFNTLQNTFPFKQIISFLNQIHLK